MRRISLSLIAPGRPYVDDGEEDPGNSLNLPGPRHACRSPAVYSGGGGREVGEIEDAFKKIEPPHYPSACANSSGPASADGFEKELWLQSGGIPPYAVRFRGKG